MTIIEWFIFFLVIQVIHFLGTWKLYVKAGRKAWEALIPIYNAIILMKIINRPTWWTILLFIPIIQLVMLPVVWVETARSFGKNSTFDTWAALLTFGFYNFYLNYFANVNYIENRSLVSKTKIGDTISSILYAVVVATLVHGYILQPFVIPTSSLEKSLLVGDFLFVSKFHYGARTPMTSVAFPMVHDSIPLRLNDSIPFLNGRSYLRKPQYPYFRLPGLQSIERNDIVVFNWPTDTVYKFFDTSGKRAFKPLDKRSNYVKRCVAIAGDTFEMKNGQIFINGKLSVMPERAKVQMHYKVVTKDHSIGAILQELNVYEYIPNFNIDRNLWEREEIKRALTSGYGNVLLEEVAKDSLKVSLKGNLTQEVYNQLKLEYSNLSADLNLTEEQAQLLRNDKRVSSVTLSINSNNFAVFPHYGNYSIDNYGPIVIPQTGATVELNADNIKMYERIISVYEKRDLKITGDEIRIDGIVTNKYTFQQDYFWMMGDNRHRSEDSRYWGFVPEDHIVGKPVFIWMSLDPHVPMNKLIDKIRWERLFTTVGGSGQPYSYFKFFVIILGGYFIARFVIKKKKKAKEDEEFYKK